MNRFKMVFYFIYANVEGENVIRNVINEDYQRTRDVYVYTKEKN